MLVTFLGILLGMRHALEPDHLAAVSTLVTEEHNPRRGALLGMCWGLGHTAALLAVGTVLALLHARMPERLADLFELGVAIMLVGLGVRAILNTARAHSHAGARGFASRSLIVGLVHGLAGSGALTALVLADLPSTSLRILYMALFGIGSVAGMAVLSGAMGVPLARVSRSRRVARALSAATGVMSASLGVWWGWPIAWRLAGA